ncbi:electron transport complex subunit RsxB [Burkholderiaceae bacterium DAT-1]|nr:electron transport complex subunit RsxB [Burkholderiaceae bacterium DAT-1]
MSWIILLIALIVPVLLLMQAMRGVRAQVQRESTVPLADRIDALLPQTQCGQCTYTGCRPYAEAIAEGKADINQCPPGGELGVRKLAALLERPYKPLDPAFGTTLPFAVARIDEDTCIGCTLCIQACPVDAIIGASKQMHSIIEDACTGCELCIAPCPVDCISMVEPGSPRAPKKKAYPVFKMKVSK